MSVLTKQQRIALIAKRKRKEAITCINHYLDLDWLGYAFKKLSKDKAPGIDGQTVKEYGRELHRNLPNLLNRVKSGKYVAPPVRRVEIPKEKRGEKRLIGIPTTEDKLLQRAVVMLLEPIFEQNFYEFSFGFRPGRSQHQAMDYLRENLYSTRTQWVVEIDIRKYFDTINHAKLREMFRKRVSDGVITKLIDKWLKAGIMKDGNRIYQDEGTPQGGVISPLLSNIFLHVVLDKWFATRVNPAGTGRSFMVRFADDAVLGFEHRSDAERFLKAIPLRFEQFGLQLNMDKTKMVPYERPRYNDNGSKPGTFGFLGFTYYWGKSRSGYWVIKQKTMKRKLQSSLKRISEWCHKNRHMKFQEQYERVCRKILGHYAYYGRTGNARSLSKYKMQVQRIWFKWLRTRNRRSSKFTWYWFNNVLKHYPLPPVKIIHSIYTVKP